MVFGKVRAYYYISFKNYYNQEKIVSIKEEEDTLWFLLLFCVWLVWLLHFVCLLDFIFLLLSIYL